MTLLSLLTCCNLTHCTHELIQVRGGCVDVRSNANAVNVLIVDPDRVDLVTVKESRHQCIRSYTIDADPADRAGKFRIERRMQLHARHLAHARRPVVLQVEDALLLALGADALVKVDGFTNALFYGKTARSQHFKLANVSAVRVPGAGKRPELFDLVRFDTHHA